MSQVAVHLKDKTDFTQQRMHLKLANSSVAPEKFKVYTERNFHSIAQISRLSKERLEAIETIASVLPFRVNQHVIDNLIDWSNIPGDPIFQLTFPQPGMITESEYDTLQKAIRSNDKIEKAVIIQAIRNRMNPHPADQISLNIPTLGNKTVEGVQHKYRETVLFFPKQGQICHTFCSFCFRWAQFIGDKELCISTKDTEVLQAYLRDHKSVSNVLITGGDPMVMKTAHLKRYIEPLLHSDFDHIQTIRIGTKSLTFWPHRFVSDPDADELLRLFEKLVQRGKHVAIMAHYNHWQELEPEISQLAIKRIQGTGAIIRSQGPVLRNINNNPQTWTRLWSTQEKLGIIPYYMFVERNTGASDYFELPLAENYEIFKQAYQNVSGLARTVRGPSMSTTYGKVEIQGITHIAAEKAFVLRFIQARDPKWVQQPFFAKYDDKATWFTQLKPLGNQEKFFFQH